jgi:pyruvate formate lyase activating enzyme
MKLSVHSILSLSAVDGTGNRTVLFLQGCNLFCGYCHNPDAIVIPHKNRAELTEFFCDKSTEGIIFGTASAQKNPAVNFSSKICSQSQPVFMRNDCIFSSDDKRLNIDNKSLDIEDVAEKLLRCKNYWGKRGGITISGGEPLLQAKGVLALCQKLKELLPNVHIAIDTSGSIKNADTDSVLKFADLVILDIKHTDSESYKKLTKNGDLDVTLENLDFLKINKVKFVVRQVIIPGINDTIEQVRTLINLCKNPPSDALEKIELLPYHTLGEKKWIELGLDYPLKGVSSTSESVIKVLRQVLNEST